MIDRILVVDDAGIVRAQLRAAFRARNYEVVEAADGIDALAQLEAYPQVSLIMLDIHMPNMNGLEFLEILSSRGSTIPVIILTAEADPEIVRRAKALGAKGWLKKPLKVEFLVGMLAKAIAPLENV